jgi:molybdate transport system regulatory protein
VRRADAAVLKPRLRLVRGGTILLGPGKADLLEAVRETGSLRRAAAGLRMSYMRAWTLVKTMNDAFREPLVALARGGAGHGGATLTRTGVKVLALYRAMEKQCLRAASPSAWRLKRFLRRK